jgi:hypothetical protein
MNYATENCLWESIRQESFKKLDENICNDLLDYYSKKSCKDNVLWLKAIEKKDVKYCSNINDEYLKNDCVYKYYRNKALQEKDISICKNITKKQENKTSSWIIIKSNSFIYLIDECINWVSLQLTQKSKDDKYCENITDKYLKQECKNSIVIDEYAPNPDDIILDWSISDFINPIPTWELENDPASKLIK